LATSCSTENSLVVQESIYDELIKNLIDEGGYLVKADEKEKLQSTMWQNGVLNRKIVAQHAQKIAGLAGIQIPSDRKFLMVEETGVGPEYPFSGEKLSVVVAIYKYREFKEAIEKVNEITGYQGAGHSCGIHSLDEDRILEYAIKTKTSRVMVRQPQCLSNSGAWTNGMPITLTLSCGTWGGNITTENIHWRHFINVTWVSIPFDAEIPSDEELFGDVMNK
jgi:sulfoacetaldehyde dehydrogenase